MPTALYEKRSITLEDAMADVKDYVDVAVKEGTEELARMVAKGFAGVDKEFSGVDKEFAGVRQQFKEVNNRFDEIDTKLTVHFERLENLIIERTK